MSEKPISFLEWKGKPENRHNSLSDYQKLVIDYIEKENESLRARVAELDGEISWDQEVRRALTVKFSESVEIIEELYNLDTLDPVVDKSYIDEAFRKASMFLQNNSYLKKQGFLDE